MYYETTTRFKQGSPLGDGYFSQYMRRFLWDIKRSRTSSADGTWSGWIDIITMPLKRFWPISKWTLPEIDPDPRFWNRKTGYPWRRDPKEAIGTIVVKSIHAKGNSLFEGSKFRNFWLECQLWNATRGGLPGPERESFQDGQTKLDHFSIKIFFLIKFNCQNFY